LSCTARRRDMAHPHVIVLGAGAMGSYYGALLSRKTEVLLVGRRKHVDAINARGLAVSGMVEGRFRVRASTEPENIPRGALVLLTTKAHDSEAAIRGVRRLLNPPTTILVLQNGLGNEDLVRNLVDPGIEVVRGLAKSGVEFLEPGAIEVKLVGETVLPRSATGKRIKRLRRRDGPAEVRDRKEDKASLRLVRLGDASVRPDGRGDLAEADDELRHQPPDRHLQGPEQ